MQGEQDLGGNDSAQSAGDLLALMVEEGDWDRYTDDVHWEKSGPLCTNCRNLFRKLVVPFFSHGSPKTE